MDLEYDEEDPLAASQIPVSLIQKVDRPISSIF